MCETQPIHLGFTCKEAMQSIVFQYPYERVYRGAKMILHHKGFSEIKSDRNKGSIRFRKYFMFFIPAQDATLSINKVDEGNTRITVSTAAKGLLFRNNKKAARTENRIVEVMASVI